MAITNADSGAAEAAAQPVAALFTFPVQIGAVRVATLDTYRSTPGSLSPGELSTALQVADIAALALSGLRAGRGLWLEGTAGAGVRYREVHQATGMLIAHLDPVRVRRRGRAVAVGRGVWWGFTVKAADEPGDGGHGRP
ncbi:hypothetical protein AB0F52_09320 [Amycolatopsis sp. NPDC024027]|uniref:hypothetical protein n=1 Tax=Amycolatopsis sp. NPDC024027 TaxID=3154327 RepID=UPI0033C85EB0